MRQQNHNTVKLPRLLLEELGVSVHDFHGSRKQRSGPGGHKGQRKAGRVQKKSRQTPSKIARPLKISSSLEGDSHFSEDLSAMLKTEVHRTTAQRKAPKSILKKSIPQPIPLEEGSNIRSPSPHLSLPNSLSQRVRDQLAVDDAEIEALERALGVKGKEKLPKAFENDGLDALLEDIDYAVDLKGTRPGKRKISEEEEWLEKKRRKARVGSAAVEDCSDNRYSAGLDGHTAFESEGSTDESDESEEQRIALEEDEPESFSGVEDGILPRETTRNKRENPYIAPKTSSTSTGPGKYLPPSLREQDAAGPEDLSQLRRQIQGLLNRLSEANIISLLGDIEKLYSSHPRRHVSTTLLDLLIGLLCDPSNLQDTFIILHAGFIAAVYKVSGTDFGAQAIERIDGEFNHYFSSNVGFENSGKRLTNLISLIAELYNFQVIGSNLIYDFVRLFLGNLSETNTELLLKIIRNSGPQLRQDDPSSLRDIVLQIQTAVAHIGEENLSVRTKFMIETMNNLKNNRMKTGVVSSSIASEHTNRMKRILGTLNQRNIRASEPLRFGLNDLRQTHKRGKWWLVGASFKDDDPGKADQDKQLHGPRLKNDEVFMDGIAADLVRLAKEQRMNTEVRRSIFIAIMSANDYNDAYLRLMKLRLKKSQELEIPKVLIHCAGAEKVYNPFYTFLSRRICADKKLKMAFQFSLWDLFKDMGEGEVDFDEGEKGGESKLELRSLVNLAKMFGVLVAEGGLGVGVLKV